MHLIRPMDDEPPPAYISFVTTHLSDLRRETDRLVGGDAEGGHAYMDVLADVAGRWRRLYWLGRLRRRDEAAEYMIRRMTSRTERWRKEQIYEVDIRVLRPPVFAMAAPGATMALRKAAVLPGTARGGAVVALADAEIAWVQAFRKHQWRWVGRWAIGGVLTLTVFIQLISWLSTPA
jgi:hypothetical protein